MLARSIKGCYNARQEMDVWLNVILLVALLTAALLAMAEAWLRLRRQPSLTTRSDMLQPHAMALNLTDLEDHVRLVALGDSIVHGHMVPADGAWPAVLESHLRGNRSDTRWTVINSGICGETVLQGWARLQRDALRFRPHVLLVAFGLNDCYLARSTTDVWREAETFPEQTFGPLGKSRLYRSARRRLLSEPPPWADAELVWRPRVEPEPFVRALEQMVRAARSARVPHIVLLTMTPVADTAHSYWPSEVQDLQMVTYHQYNDLIRTAAASLQASLIDVQARFVGSDLTPLLDYDGIHLTAAGQAQLADIVYAALHQSGTLTALRHR
jgi:lysophospholipase L1-like esterase